MPEPLRLTVLNGSRRRNEDRRASSTAPGHPAVDSREGWIEAELQRIVSGTPTQIRFGTHDRLLYATDASLYQQTPLGVVAPSSPEVAAKVVAWCGRNGVPVLPRGGGTSLAGQCTNRAVVVDVTPMCRVIGEVKAGEATKSPNREDQGREEHGGGWRGDWVEADAGVTVDELNDALSKRGHGLFFAPDPATTKQAAIGGCIGNNAAGSRSIRYGRTSENLVAVEAALSSGERVWLHANAGEHDAVARRLATRVISVVRSVEPLIRERYPRTIRRNAGYGLDMILAQLDAGATERTLDLSPLVCGSEGTLALTMRARVKLMPTPAARGLMVVSFATVEDAIAAVKPLLDAGRPLGLSAVEMLDDVVLDAARGNIEYKRYVDLLPGADATRREPKAALYVEFSAFGMGATGRSAGEELAEGFRVARGVLESSALAASLRGVAEYTEAPAMLKAWALRRAGEPLLHGLPGPRKPITFVEDNAVPVERLGEFVAGFKGIVAKYGTKAAYWAHASVGVLHVRPMIDLHDPADRERMVKIAVEVADLARRCGGIMSGEHGDGKVRGPLLERFFGLELMDAFVRIKEVFDPAGVLNPGNIVGPYPGESSIAQGLRIDASGSGEKGALGQHSASQHSTRIPSAHTGDVPGIETYFAYNDQHGFMGAAEQCNGAGVCRKRSGGTMCPSYRATQDERHSTRGRGNALRLALTGQVTLVDSASGGASVGSPSFDDPETIQTLNLCLSCKACKSECPSNVDISRLKAEYTAQRHRIRGTPIKARVFGHVRVLNHLGSIVPSLANRFNRLGITKSILRTLLGIDPRRSVPRFERSLWRALNQRRKQTAASINGHPGLPNGSEQACSQAHDANRPVVVLYADCFTAYNEPRIGLAAVRVLESLGYSVLLLPDSAGASGCCGRAMISTGCLDDATTTIDRTLQLLLPALDDERAVAVVVCEPSCLSAIKDDWLELKLSTPLAHRQALADRAFMVEDFIEARWNHHPDRNTVERLVRHCTAVQQSQTAHPSALFHGHCHQKALWGPGSSAALLTRLLGKAARSLDTGCCGMAGSFGYTTDRYDLSMRIGEESLFPSVRSADAGSTVCAPGTSCRHQIHDGTGRKALHPIELIDALLTESDRHAAGPSIRV